MTGTRLDVLAIGDAVVDVIATAEDSFLDEEGLVKGSMQVLDAAGATRLYARMSQARETSGGSAANTMAGVAALGGRAGFVGQVSNDQLGEIFTHDIRALGVEFLTPARKGGEPTGRCLILVTPDAQRTMNTFRGAAHELSAEALDHQQIRDAAILYLEAYLWRSPGPRAAMDQAMATAHAAGRKVAFTLSDIACIRPHRAEMMAMLEAGAIDLLFANENEIMALADTGDRASAVAAIQDKVPLIVVTCGSEGAMAIERGVKTSVPIARIGAGVVDTTGAGDLFAAGFLVGQTQGRSLEDALKFAEIARNLGGEMARRGIGLVYGGGRLGLMGVVADAVLAGGGEVYGVIPQALVDLEVAHTGCTELHLVANMHERKAMMTDLTDAFVAIPGGVGTFDELFEAWSWNALGYHAKPFAILNVDGFWDSMITFLDHVTVSGFMSPARRAQLQVADDIDGMIDGLDAAIGATEAKMVW